jgi:hypothetical protein
MRFALDCLAGICAVLLLMAAAGLVVLLTIGIANAAPIVLTNPLWLVP